MVVVVLMVELFVVEVYVLFDLVDFVCFSQKDFLKLIITKFV